jgi:hypothetical protein
MKDYFDGVSDTYFIYNKTSEPNEFSEIQKAYDKLVDLDEVSYESAKIM